MDITLSIVDEVIQEARRRAEALGTSVNQSVRDYLDQFVASAIRGARASELRRLSELAKGYRFGGETFCG